MVGAFFNKLVGTFLDVGVDARVAQWSAQQITSSFLGLNTNYFFALMSPYKGIRILKDVKIPSEVVPNSFFDGNHGMRGSRRGMAVSTRAWDGCHIETIKHSEEFEGKLPNGTA